MGKKDFVRLADLIKDCNKTYTAKFNMFQIDALGDFCMEQNPRFDRGRWIGYIRGECGPNGGRVK